MRFAFLLFLFFASVFLAFSKEKKGAGKQIVHPTNYFSSPVNHPITLSGTYGELRTNHFHEGIDIRPIDGEGEPILAAADGYVARIRVMPRGYGNALYLKHPAGYTTVYGHLKSYAPGIQAYIKAIQYRSQCFEQDREPDSLLFPVKKGDIIGYMGNTGSSSGAHLHFEIRDSKTETPLNPQLFGFDIEDDLSPEIKGVKVYCLDDSGHELAGSFYPVKKSGDGYKTDKPITVNGDYTGISVVANDVANGVKNRTGIYGISLYHNEEQVFAFHFDNISYDDTRYINAHMDYLEAREGRRMHRCFNLPGNLLNIYERDNPKGGIFPLEEGGKVNLEAKVKDTKGNASTLSLIIQKGKSPAPVAKEPSYDFMLEIGKPFVKKTENIELSFQPYSCYENYPCPYAAAPSSSEDCWSDVHIIGSPYVPVQQYFDIAIKPTRPLPDSLLGKAVLTNSYGTPRSLGGVWENGFLKSRSVQFGHFSIMTDLTPPSVTPIFKGKGPLTYDKAIAFRVTDNLTGITSFNAWINGEWVLMEYDMKSNSLTHRFGEDVEIPKGKNNIRLAVSDAVGNTNVWEGTFLKK